MFILFTQAAGYFPAEVHFLYVAKIIMVGLLLWFWRHAYASEFSFKLTREGYLIAIVVGLVVMALWILPDSFFRNMVLMPFLIPFPLINLTLLFIQ